MLRRLLQRRIEGDTTVTGQMLVAMLIGSVGDVWVPDGEVVGGTFGSIPLCTEDTERGCVITYSTYADGYPVEPAGADVRPLDESAPPNSDWACTNPGALGGGPSLGAGALFPSTDQRFDWSVTSDFVLIEGFYTTECKRGAFGKSVLALSATPATGDQRADRIPYEQYSSFLGMHGLDFVIPMEELKDQVRSRM